MVKTHTTVNIDSDLREKAKKDQINISETLEDALRIKLSTPKFIDYALLDDEIDLFLKDSPDEWKSKLPGRCRLIKMRTGIDITVTDLLARINELIESGKV